jgi:protein-S-isoprenylcysteine O-methyltransferase Ste14
MLIAGAALILNSFVITDLLEFIGIKHIFKIKTKNVGLTTNGVYGLIRHPLYLGGMMILWANPWMRIIDFTVASLFTLYFFIGATLEERKLEEEFGQGYIDYKKNVSMFLPVKWLKDFIQR